MDRITLENFRCFREAQTARMAPLTLLVGENSTGKTSFLALIQALWDARGFRAPDFKEKPYDLGSFDEIAHHRGARGGRADTFSAGFDLAREGEKGTVTRFKITFGRKGTTPIPVKWHIANEGDHAWVKYRLREDRSWEVLFETPKGVWRHEPSRPLMDDDRMFPFYLILGRISRRHLKAVEGSRPPSDRDWDRIEQIFHSVLTLARIAERPYASAPVRSKPHRTYDPSRPTRDPEGDYIPMYLASIRFEKEKTWQRLKKLLEDFGQESGLFDEISVRPLGKKQSEPFQIQIRKYGSKSKGPRRNLIDVGYGVSQALPIVTELLRGDAPPMFLLQQPEVHLHPSAQAALGSLFCRIAGPKRQLVIETHSDHLLDRVRMDVRDGTAALKPEDVSILYFERGDLDVRIHSLRLDEQGNVLDAPPSYGAFFMEETRRSLGL